MFNYSPAIRFRRRISRAQKLLIPVTDIDLKAGEYERIRKASGDAVWIATGRKATFLNQSADAARFIVVQFKAPAKD
jgi:hypothetical protein